MARLSLQVAVAHCNASLWKRRGTRAQWVPVAVSEHPAHSQSPFLDMTQSYDLVLVGSSFASSFFLHEYLRNAGPNARVLVLERGVKRPWKTSLIEKRQAALTLQDVAVSNHPNKTWVSNLTFGGNSNCWWGCTPRLHPSDFKTQSLYGVGMDWPFSFEDLDPYYVLAEQIMAISGEDQSPCIPRSQSLPQPPHNNSDVEIELKNAYPDLFFTAPSARPRIATENRPACCATARCHLCPIDAKFRIQNEMMAPYQDPRVELRTDAEVTHLECTNKRANAISYRQRGTEHRIHAEYFALGANAFFNAAILARSGCQHQWLGRGLGEQSSYSAQVLTNGLKSMQGSTSVTGHGYMLYDGEHRKERAGCLLEFKNAPDLRPEPGRWQEIFHVKMMFEDIPRGDNRVILRDDGKAQSIYLGCGEYAKRSMKIRKELLEKALAPLPVEKILMSPHEVRTESHIQGTTRMGHDPELCVLDENLRLHSHSNIFALGAGSFPTCSAANPTLTLSALSLKAARSLWN